MDLSPERRVNTITNQIIPTIMINYKDDLWLKDEALDKLNQYINKGYNLTSLIEDEDEDLYHELTTQLERCYNLYKSEIEKHKRKDKDE